MSRFADKVALVTGGGAGLGRAIALRLAEGGAKVVVAGRNEADGGEVVGAIAASGGQAQFVRTDVVQAHEVKALVASAIAAFGGLDIAVNNAGVEGSPAPITHAREEDFDRVIATNVKGVWLCMKYEILHMKDHGGGAIVNVASMAGLVGVANLAPYVASKHAVMGLTKTAALEFGAQGVRVNAVCPGSVRTRMLDRLLAPAGDQQARVIEQMTRQYPVGRLGTPEEVADAVAWLCSSEASFVLGQGVAVDGGYTVA